MARITTPMMSWRPLTNALLSALLSPPCAACAAVLDAPLDGAVCSMCWHSIEPAACDTCHTCPSITRGLAIGEYHGRLRDVIHALKYDGRRSVAPPLSMLMAQHGAGVLSDASIVVPVPLHRARERARGFNQANDLAARLGLPVVQALRRVTATHAQVDLPAAQRHANVKDAFALNVARTEDLRIKNQIVVLVDDVTTTGATLEACALVLKQYGARQIRALTAARVLNAPR